MEEREERAGNRNGIDAFRRFERTFNLKRSDYGYVSCCRCGYEFFKESQVRELQREIDGDTPPGQYTVLPMFQNDMSPTFAKSPFRVILTIICPSGGLRRMSIRRMDTHNNLTTESGRPIHSVRHVYSDKERIYAIIDHAHEVAARMLPEMKQEQTVVITGPWQKYEEDELQVVMEAMRDIPGREDLMFHKLKDLDQTNVYENTFDFGLIIRVDSGTAWTDFSCKNTEVALVKTWIATGGNMLFGDTSTENDRKAMRRIHQPTFDELAKDGHYLGHWNREEDPPGHIEEMIKTAMAREPVPEAGDTWWLNNGGNWMFREDFPQHTFEIIAREGGNTSRVQHYVDLFTPTSWKRSRAKGATNLLSVCHDFWGNIFDKISQKVATIRQAMSS